MASNIQSPKTISRQNKEKYMVHTENASLYHPLIYKLVAWVLKSLHTKLYQAILYRGIYHMFLHIWSEISLFHKFINDIRPGSLLRGWDVAVRLLRHR